MSKFIEPGTYRLTRDVQNPSPDRRYKNDWRFAPTWKAGTEFLVVGKTSDVLTESDVDAIPNITPEQRAKLLRKVCYIAICLVGHRWTHESIGPHDEERYGALVDAFEAVPESHEAMFTRLGVQGGFDQWLVTSGKMSPAEFEKLWDAYHDEPDPEEPAVQGTVTVLDQGPVVVVPERSDEL